jgi:FAD/FMN-containing dehydrogenase
VRADDRGRARHRHDKHLRRVLAVDAERLTATVEPGLVLDHLNAH